MTSHLIYWIVTAAVGISIAAITIYNGRRWNGRGKFLCQDCRFNSQTLCLKVERPTAIRCTSYRSLEK